jgi:CBS domain-containing protein
MQIRDVMTAAVRVADPKTTMAEAARQMRDADVGALPVGTDRLDGMVTDRDLVVRGLAADLDPVSTPIEKLMSAETLYCFEDQDCEEVAINMGEQQVRRLPVVDRDKKLVGFVALSDLMRGTEASTLETSLQQITH